MGLKRGAIGNTLVEHIGNLMGTHWDLEGNPLELEGNMLGTKEKRTLPMLSLPIGCMNF
jgi:hypothetical protein